MNKLPEVFEFQFDPAKSDLEVLKNRKGLILWSCVKSGHIVDQYFNDDVLDVVKRIDKEKTPNYAAFKNVIKSSNLSKFGQISIEENMFSADNEMDHRFWRDIWYYTIGKKRQNIKIIER